MMRENYQTFSKAVSIKTFCHDNPYSNPFVFAMIFNSALLFTLIYSVPSEPLLGNVNQRLHAKQFCCR